jgi:hypothetical protein
MSINGLRIGGQYAGKPPALSERVIGCVIGWPIFFIMLTGFLIWGWISLAVTRPDRDPKPAAPAASVPSQSQPE